MCVLFFYCTPSNNNTHYQVAILENLCVFKFISVRTLLRYRQSWHIMINLIVAVKLWIILFVIDTKLR